MIKTLAQVLIFLGLFILLPMQPAMAYSDPVSVELNGLPVNFDTDPEVRNDRILVPFRGLAESLHVQVMWIAADQTVEALAAGTKVRLQVGNTTAYIDDKVILLDAAPVISNGRVLVPLRFFSEVFGCQVTWMSGERKVSIISPPESMEVLGYYALGDSATSSWEDLFGQPYPQAGKGNTDLVDSVALGWYSLDGEGNLLTSSRTGWQRPSGWEDVLSAARSKGSTNQMTIHMVNGNGEITALLSSPESCQRAVEEILGEVQYFDGVNLDLEGLGLSEKGTDLERVRQQYTALASGLAQGLHAQGKTLSVSLHAPNSSYQGYDYAALGQICDQVIIMAYDYGSHPEPMSLVTQAVEKSLQYVPAHKLVLGISVPSEDEDSILLKVELARRYELQGIALWRLGLVPDGMWHALRTRITADQL